MAEFKLVTRAERDGGMALLADLSRHLYRLNVTNHLPLITDTQHPDSVYRLLSETAQAVCRQLGWDADQALQALVSDRLSVSDYAHLTGEYEQKELPR